VREFKILHICTDEKFIDGMIDIFESVFPKRNKFLIIGNKNKKLTHVKNKNIVIGGTKYLYCGGAKRDVSSVNIKIIHYLTDVAAFIALKAPSNVKIIWSGWGADYYRLMQKVDYESVLPKTRKLSRYGKSKAKPIGSIKSWFINYINKLAMKNSVNDLIERADYFSSPIPTEYQLVKRDLKGFKAKPIQINYGGIEKGLPGCEKSRVKKNIFIGNSATATNNHIEIFEILKNIIMSDVKIVVPLSYGSLEYKEKILAIGYEYFGKQFQPLTGFLPLIEYQEILEECHFVVMNHIRQQGLGNVLMALHAGKKVFLRKESVIYGYLLSIGMEINSVDDINSDSLATFIDDSIVSNNRAIIEKYWSENVIKNNVEKIEAVVFGKGQADEKL